jgi:hypothetical protein
MTTMANRRDHLPAGASGVPTVTNDSEWAGAHLGIEGASR